MAFLRGIELNSLDESVLLRLFRLIPEDMLLDPSTWLYVEMSFNYNPVAEDGSSDVIIAPSERNGRPSPYSDTAAACLKGKNFWPREAELSLLNAVSVVA